MNAGQIVASLKLKIDDFQNGVDRATQEVEKFNKKFSNVSSDFKKVGAGMVAVGTGIGVGLGGAVKTAADFEAAMSRVGALSGANAKELEDMTKKARELGATTSFSASQAAEGMSYLAMAGWKTNDIIAGMGGVLDMAAAGQIALGDAANIASNIMSGFSIEASKSNKVADILTKTFTNSNTTLLGLGETMKYAAPAAASVGWSLEEMAAAAGKLGDVGIDASMAGTALRAAVTRLSAPTGKAAKLLNQFGIETTTADGKLRPLHDILGQMKTKFGDLSDAEKAAAVQTIFGTEAMSAMLALMADPEGLENFTVELQNAGGTAEEIATKQLDNLNGSVTVLKSAFEEAQISLGNALIPAIRFLAEALNGALNWFNALPYSVKSGIAIFAALSAVLLVVGGSILLFIGFIPNIIAGFKAMTTVFGGLKLAVSALGKAFIWLFTNPVGLIILGIAALIAAIVLIWKNWDTVKEKTIQIWEAIKSFLSAAWDAIKSVFQSVLDSLKSVWESVWNAIKSVGMAIWNGIKEAFITVWNAMWNVVSTILAVIYALIMTVFEGIKAVAMAIWGAIGDYVIAVWNSIKSAAETIWNGIKAVFEFVWNAIKTYFTTVLNIYKTIFTTVWTAIKTTAETIWNALKAAATTVFEAIKAVITTVMNAIKAVVIPIWNTIKSGITTVWNGIKSAASSVWNSIKSVISSVVNAIKSVITSVFNSIKSVITNVWSGIKSATSGAIDFVRSKVSSGASFIQSTFTGALNAVKSAFGGLWGSIRQSLQNVVDGIKSKVSQAKEWLSELNPFKRHSPSLVDNVLAGTKIIKDTYESLSGMQLAPPTIGSITAGRLDVESVFGGDNNNGGAGGTTYNAPIVQVENMNVRDDQDIRRVSNELFNLQRSHDRSKGGR